MPSLAGLASQAASNLSSALSQAQSITSSVQGAVQNVLQQGQSLANGLGLQSISGALNSVSGKLNSILPSFQTSFARADFANKSILTADRGSKSPTESQPDRWEGTLAFPSDIPKYWAKFTFKKYVRPTALERKQEAPIVEVVFPMPVNLSEDMSVEYNKLALGAIIGGSTTALDEYAKGKIGANEVIGRLKASFDKNTAAVALRNVISSQADGTLGVTSEAAGAAIDRALGAVANPHLAVVFKQADLRTHTFSYRFSPNTLSESERLKDIIRKIKSRILPGKVGEFVLTFPDTVTVTFGPTGAVGAPFLIKTCVVQDFKVNYSPQGSVAFFRNGQPAEIELTMTLQETEVHTREDYETPSVDRIRGGV